MKIAFRIEIITKVIFAKIILMHKIVCMITMILNLIINRSAFVADTFSFNLVPFEVTYALKALK